jgi:hypothetical protein
MRTATIASILSKIVTVHLFSLIASSEVSDAHDTSSKLTNNNGWNLKRVIVRKNGTTTEDAADVNYLEQTCGCSLERHEFYLDVPCDGNCKLFSIGF